MKKLIFALIAGATVMGAAQAEGAYIGAGVATATHNYNLGGATVTSSDGYKASGKVFGGYEFDKTWGVEAGYTDFSKSKASYTRNGVPGTLDSSGNSTYVAAKASAPLNEQVSLFGKVGAANNKSTLTATDPTLNRSQNKTELYAGFGAQYNLNKQVALTAEYERYGKSKDFGTKADVFSLGARYSF